MLPNDGTMGIGDLEWGRYVVSTAYSKVATLPWAILRMLILVDLSGACHAICSYFAEHAGEIGDVHANSSLDRNRKSVSKLLFQIETLDS